RRWGDVLDRLETEPESLIGRVDWITKRMLLDTCAAGAPWAVRKKIDLRYHELSPEGYFQRLCAAGVAHRVLPEAEIEAARRGPPGLRRARFPARCAPRTRRRRRRRARFPRMTSSASPPSGPAGGGRTTSRGWSTPGPSTSSPCATAIRAARPTRSNATPRPS